MSLLGIDIGTSGCKATLIDYKGKILGSAYKEYALESPQPGWQELDPQKVWECTQQVIYEAVEQYRGEPVLAISVSSFGEAAVPIDKEGKVLYNSIIYIDERGREEAEYLKEHLGFHEVLDITGASIHPMYTLFKVMWIKKNRPDIYSKVWKFLLFSGFILFKLGGIPHTDYSLAARTMAFDVKNKKWSEEILNFADVDIDIFGKAVQAGTIVGEIKPEIAMKLGLQPGVLLVSGGHDQPCAALGAGVIHSGNAVDGMGTTECITPAFHQQPSFETMAKSSFACVPHVVKNIYVTYAFSFTSGSLLKWYRDNFGREYTEEALRRGVNVYDAMIDSTSGIVPDLFVLPHFAGAATPYMDTRAKGAIVGLNIRTCSNDIIKAILEGITFEMVINMEHLKEAGILIHELRAVGGLSKSEKFLQLKADIMGKKVVTLEISEAGTLGVAILAGTAAGVYKCTEAAVAELVRVKRVFEPDESLHLQYQEKFEIYKRIYPYVKQIYHY